MIGKSNRKGGYSGESALDEIIEAAAPCNNTVLLNNSLPEGCDFKGPLISLLVYNHITFSGMGFEGIVMTVSVREFLFDGVKTGSAGWMIGLNGTGDGTPGPAVSYITDRLPITVFGQENGFALFNHKNDTMENEWYEVRKVVRKRGFIRSA